MPTHDPVLIREGDTYYLDGSDYMASRIPGAVNVRVADAGHGVNVDQPGVVNGALGDFLVAL